MARQRTAAPTGSSTVERNIYFYLMSPEQDDDTLPPISTILSHILGLPFTDSGRYFTDREGKVSAVWPIPSPSQNKAMFGITRRTGLPQKEVGGTLSPLNVPAAGGLAEQTHMVFFQTGASVIIGSEYNHYGPRVPGFRHYLKARCASVCCPVLIEPILRSDVLRQLANLADIRLLDIKVKASGGTIQRGMLEQLPFFSALSASAQSSGADSIEVVLRPKPFDREATLSDTIMSWVQSLRQRGLPERVERMVVRGYNSESEQVEYIDLIKSMLISTKRILKVTEKGKSLDSESAFAAIEEAYRENLEEIQASRMNQHE